MTSSTSHGFMRGQRARRRSFGSASALLAIALTTWAALATSSAAGAEETASPEDAAADSIVILPSGCPQGPCPSLRDGDELWLLSSRRLSHCEPCPPPLDVVRCRQEWVVDSLTTLCSTPFDGSTIIYVHGNRYAAEEAVTRGMLYYDALSRRSAQPLRMVIWSWPSDQIDGNLNDVKTKAARTPVESFYLGWVLQQLAACHTARSTNDDARIGLVGHSFGARIIAGALHACAGGRINGRTLCGQPVCQPSFRVALLAAALDFTWMCPGDCYGRAQIPVYRLMVTTNQRDPVLKFFRFLRRGPRDRALGSKGLPSHCCSCRLIHLDVSRAIGRSHDELSYLQHRDVMNRIAGALLH